MGTVHQLKVARATEEEIKAVREYLNAIENVLEDNWTRDEDDHDSNKEIADVARKYPRRSFLIPLNLGILLDNYQDKESTVLEHPKWIKEMISLFEDMDKYISEKPDNYIGSGSEFHMKIKKILVDE